MLVNAKRRLGFGNHTPNPMEIRARLSHARDGIGEAMEKIHDREKAVFLMRRCRIDIELGHQGVINGCHLATQRKDKRTVTRYRVFNLPALREAHDLLEDAERQRASQQVNEAKASLACGWCVLRGMTP